LCTCSHDYTKLDTFSLIFICLGEKQTEIKYMSWHAEDGPKRSLDT